MKQRDPLRSDVCSRLLKAVAEPDRLRIIQCLRNGPKTVGEIASRLDSPIANASHHLKLLKAAGLATSVKEGRFVRYALAAKFAKEGRGPTLDVLDFGCCRMELPEM